MSIQAHGSTSTCLSPLFPGSRLCGTQQVSFPLAPVVFRLAGSTCPLASGPCLPVVYAVVFSRRCVSAVCSEHPPCPGSLPPLSPSFAFRPHGTFPLQPDEKRKFLPTPSTVFPSTKTPTRNGSFFQPFSTPSQYCHLPRNANPFPRTFHTPSQAKSLTKNEKSA